MRGSEVIEAEKSEFKKSKHEGPEAEIKHADMF